MLAGPAQMVDLGLKEAGHDPSDLGHYDLSRQSPGDEADLVFEIADPVAVNAQPPDRQGEAFPHTDCNILFSVFLYHCYCSDLSWCSLF